MLLHVDSFLLSHTFNYLNVKKTTLSNGYLGSRNDEERSEMRYVMRIAEFSESSNLWTQIALLGSPRSTPLSVSVQPSLSSVGNYVWLENESRVPCVLVSWNTSSVDSSTSASAFGRNSGSRLSHLKWREYWPLWSPFTCILGASIRLGEANVVERIHMERGSDATIGFVCKHRVWIFDLRWSETTPWI